MNMYMTSACTHRDQGMKKILLFSAMVFLSLLSMAQMKSDRTRLIILADMGNEPDEEQQMMHLLMCSNEFALEGLISVTGKFLQPANKDPYRQVLHPELFHTFENSRAFRFKSPRVGKECFNDVEQFSLDLHLILSNPEEHRLTFLI